MKLKVKLKLALLVITLTVLATPVLAQRPPDQDYLVYVVSESSDKVSLIRFGPQGARVETSFETGVMPTDVDGPHGVAVSPDNRYAFVSVEGIGSEPGTVEIIDLEALKTITTVDVAPQAAGIDFWKMEKAESKQ